MAVRDHGFWKQYIPAEPPTGIPRGAVFCKRESDGFDWYEYVNVEKGNAAHKGRVKQFKPGTVKCVIEPKGRGKEDEPVEPIIRTAAVDETRLFPQDCQLIELEDVKRDQNEAALIEEFVNRKIDLKTGELGEKWEPRMPEPQIDTRVADALEKILARLEKLEGKSNGGDR